MAPDFRDGYWNHNTAFHPEILRRCRATDGPILDVGCGDGLLVSRMARMARPVVGIEPDPAAAAQARRRCHDLTNVVVLEASLDDAALDDASFGFLAVVATLHHMQMGSALGRCARLLQPGGRLYVLGLTRIASRADVVRAAASMPRARLVGTVRSETWPQAVPTAEPSETFSEVRSLTRAVLPGARLRRRSYYRYSLEWTKP